MGFLGDLVRGMLILSFLAFIQNGFSVKTMAERAVKAYKEGLSSYQEYSNKLTGYKLK